MQQINIRCTCGAILDMTGADGYVDHTCPITGVTYRMALLDGVDTAWRIPVIRMDGPREEAYLMDIDVDDDRSYTITVDFARRRVLFR